jgi:hypothetical protein
VARWRSSIDLLACCSRFSYCETDLSRPPTTTTGSAQHRKEGWRLQRHIGSCGFEISRDVILVALAKSVPQERRPTEVRAPAAAQISRGVPCYALSRLVAPSRGVRARDQKTNAASLRVEFLAVTSLCAKRCIMRANRKKGAAMSNHGTALSDDTIIRVDRSTPVVYPHYWWLVCSTSFEVRNTSIVSSRAMAAPAPMNRPSSASANAVFGTLVYNASSPG